MGYRNRWHEELHNLPRTPVLQRKPLTWKTPNHDIAIGYVFAFDRGYIGTKCLMSDIVFVGDNGIFIIVIRPDGIETTLRKP